MLRFRPTWIDGCGLRWMRVRLQAEPVAVQERVAPPMRPPITVDQDIVFGQDANDDDKDGW